MCHGPGCLLLIGALNGEPVDCFHCHLVVINYYLYGHCHRDIGFERGVWENMWSVSWMACVHVVLSACLKAFTVIVSVSDEYHTSVCPSCHVSHFVWCEVLRKGKAVHGINWRQCECALGSSGYAGDCIWGGFQHDTQSSQTSGLPTKGTGPLLFPLRFLLTWFISCFTVLILYYCWCWVGVWKLWQWSLLRSHLVHIIMACWEIEKYEEDWSFVIVSVTRRKLVLCQNR